MNQQKQQHSQYTHTHKHNGCYTYEHMSDAYGEKQFKPITQFSLNSCRFAGTNGKVCGQVPTDFQLFFILSFASSVW